MNQFVAERDGAPSISRSFNLAISDKRFESIVSFQKACRTNLSSLKRHTFGLLFDAETSVRRSSSRMGLTQYIELPAGK